RLVGARDVGDQGLGWERNARDALVVVARRCDLAGPEGAVPLLVRQRATADPAACRPDVRARELRMAAVETRVDDRDTYGAEHGQLRPERVERVVLAEIVLPRRERVVRGEARPCRRRFGRR